MDETLTRLQKRDTIVIGDLSTDIRKLQNPGIQKVTDLMTEFGFMDLLHQFWKRWRYWLMKM